MWRGRRAGDEGEVGHARQATLRSAQPGGGARRASCDRCHGLGPARGDVRAGELEDREAAPARSQRPLSRSEGLHRRPTMTTTSDVIVVGAGLAGQTAGATAAAGGARTSVLETARPGGRARTAERAGAVLNHGPHALYRGGEALPILRRLGVAPRGVKPPLSRYWLRLGGQPHQMPSGLPSLLATGALGVRSKAQLSKVLGSLPLTDPTSVAGVSVDDWVAGKDLRPDAEQVLRALVPIGTYADDTSTMSADAAVLQLRRDHRGASGGRRRRRAGGGRRAARHLRLGRPGWSGHRGVPRSRRPQAADARLRPRRRRAPLRLTQSPPARQAPDGVRRGRGDPLRGDLGRRGSAPPRGGGPGWRASPTTTWSSAASPPGSRWRPRHPWPASAGCRSGPRSRPPGSRERSSPETGWGRRGCSPTPRTWSRRPGCDGAGSTGRRCGHPTRGSPPPPPAWPRPASLRRRAGGRSTRDRGCPSP